METQQVTTAMLPAKQAIFPHANIRNIALYYFLTATTNAWYMAGNWIFFWLRLMNYGQLGLVDATAFAFGLLMEVPSGAVSDLIGKRKTIIAAMFCASFGTLGIAFAQSVWQLWFAFLFAQLGWALYSGAAEALAYDTLVDHKQEDHFEDVASTSGSIAQVMGIVATLFGGILYVMNFRLPHLAWSFTYLLGLISAWFLVEPHIDTQKFSFSSYFAQLKDGMKHLFSPALKPYLMLIFTVLGVDYMYNWGLVKPAVATAFGFFDKEQAIIFGICGILSGITVRFIPAIRKRISDKLGLFVLTGIMAIAFLLASLPLGYLGILPILLISLSGTLAYPWVSIVTNKEILSQYRATTLSTVALITKIPYVLLAVIAGNMVEKGTFNIFLLSVGIIAVIAMIISEFQKLTQHFTKSA